MHPRKRKAAILVVDDEEDVRETLAELLANEGYHAIMASGGRDALHKMESFLPDLVITDITMPDMNGGELMLALAADARFQDIPVMVVTALPERAMQVLGDRRQRVPVVGKPIAIGRFVELVEVVLKGRGEAAP
jgi:CheY-like chemotaxis protein